MRRRLAVAVALSVWLSLSSWAGRSFAADRVAAPAANGDPAAQILVLLRAPPPHFRPNATYGDGYDDGLGRAARRRVAARLARAHGLTLVTDWPMPLLGLDCFVMAAPAGRSAEAEAVLLSRDPGVAWSEPMHVYSGQSAPAAPNDPLFRAQPAAVQWRLADLHQMSTGRNVLVAVIDSQIERNHPDLVGQVQVDESFVPGPPVAGEDHGTGVAGVIAARANNGVGIAGVAPDARLMALRACWQLGPAPAATLCDSLTLAKALEFAIDHRARVINLSIGGPSDILLGRLIDVALARGVAVVGAYDHALPGGGFPASHAGVVAVTDGPVEGGMTGVYTAPGRDVPTTQPGGRWSFVNGSSFAAAHVSGLMALMRQGGEKAGRTPVLVTEKTGGGAIDACASLVRALGSCDCACARPAGVPAVGRD